MRLSSCGDACGSSLLRLALALLQTSGFRLTVARLPDGRDKLRILRAVDRAEGYFEPTLWNLRYRVGILSRCWRSSPDRDSWNSFADPSGTAHRDSVPTETSGWLGMVSLGCRHQRIVGHTDSRKVAFQFCLGDWYARWRICGHERNLPNHDCYEDTERRRQH
jgi:hypothetical protein